jgi:insulysin
MKTKIFIVPAKDVRHVNLTFPIEDLTNFYSASPDGFVAQLVGHKGPGSLFAHLRKKGLAHHLVKLID